MKINILIKPGSSKGPLIEPGADDSLVVYVREAAVDGKANEALIRYLAKYYDVPKTKVHIIHGQASRRKLVEIDI